MIHTGKCSAQNLVFLQLVAPFGPEVVKMCLSPNPLPLQNEVCIIRVCWAFSLHSDEELHITNLLALAVITGHLNHS